MSPVAKTNNNYIYWETVDEAYLWQERFYDFLVLSETKKIEKLRFMHRNPVRRGLVSRPEQWRWSRNRRHNPEVGIQAPGTCRCCAPMRQTGFKPVLGLRYSGLRGALGKMRDLRRNLLLYRFSFHHKSEHSKRPAQSVLQQLARKRH